MRPLPESKPCPKCGSPAAFHVAFCRGALSSVIHFGHRGAPEGEHLWATCQTCGYAESRPCLDAVPPAGPCESRLERAKGAVRCCKSAGHDGPHMGAVPEGKLLAAGFEWEDKPAPPASVLTPEDRAMLRQAVEAWERAVPKLDGVAPLRLHNALDPLAKAEHLWAEPSDAAVDG